MKKIVYLAILFPFMVIAQTPTTTQNYVRSKTYKVATTTSIASPTPQQATQSITYLDGLGRPIQQIANAQSNTSKDIVTHIEYDAFGRQVREYLPFASAQNTMGFTDATTLKQAQLAQYQSWYGDNNPFSEKLLESSPLNRVLEQAAPGNDWSLNNPEKHTIRLEHQTNHSLEVRRYSADAEWSENYRLYNNSILEQSFYEKSMLYKTITKDENWTGGLNNTTEEFKDKEGRVVLKRSYNQGEAHDTYYVYDDYGNLTYVIPPAVNCEAGISSSVLNNMCYQYKYDKRNRLVEKKLPGKQWEFIVYNSQNMPVMTGPAQHPWRGDEWGWIITKYDIFGRVVYTGWYKNFNLGPEQRKDFQSNYDGNMLWAERFIEGTSSIDQVPTSYTNDVFPTDFKLLTINYYDNYSYVNAPNVPTNIEGENLLTNVKGMPTGNWVRGLTSPEEIVADFSYSFYDTKGREISTFKTNNIGGYTSVEKQLDFIGKVLQTKTKHKKSENVIETTIIDNYSYSPQERLLTHVQTINEQQAEVLIRNEYDELGQLITKSVGGSENIILQKVDYQYNIRGWLKSINNINSLNGADGPVDLFAFELRYNNPAIDGLGAAVSPLYNGNISETYWRSNSDNVLRKYGYQYDHLNRLTTAIYQKPNFVMPVTNMYDETLWYDKNGNIAHLNRNGDFDHEDSSAALQIDDLTYIYDQEQQNQLLKVIDNTLSPQGFKDSNDNDYDDYRYDENGNMVVDRNKEIIDIKYNHLNLPIIIQFNRGDKIEYIYNAVGQKLSKKVTQGSTITTTDYMDGFQYTNGILNFFPHPEGYAYALGDTARYKFFYVYNYTDHLGNIRVSYGKDPLDGILKIIEENHYYPFGLKHTNYNSGKKKYEKQMPPQPSPEEAAMTTATPITQEEIYKIRPLTAFERVDYKYKYNGKEYQDELGLNMYDYGARNYDPALGRWMNIDPKAEKYFNHSPYTYVLNNPVFCIDPNGMEVDVTNLANSNRKGDSWLLLQLMISLADISGMTVKQTVDKNGKHTLTGTGEANDTHAAKYVSYLLNKSETITVNGTDSPSVTPYGNDTYLNSAQLNGMQQGLKNSGIDKDVMSVGMGFLHESIHTLVGADYWKKAKSQSEKKSGIFDDSGDAPGNVEKRLNIFRQELKLPTLFRYSGATTLFVEVKGEKIKVPYSNQAIDKKTDEKAKKEINSNYTD